MEHLTNDLPTVKQMTPAELEKKKLSQKRLFWAVFAIDIVVAALIAFTILEAFLG